MSFYNHDEEPTLAAASAADTDTVVVADVSLDGTIKTMTLAALRQALLTGIVSVPDATTYTVLAANSGRVHVLPNLTADIVITLPAEVSGLDFEFVYGGIVADAQDWQFDSGSDTNYFIGGVVHLDTDSNDAGDEVVPIAGDGNSNSKMNVLVPDVGTRVRLTCDGTLWVLTGQVVGATAPTFADQ